MKDTKFKPGKSGNPKGRAKGVPDKRTAYRELFREKGPEIINKVIEKALEGDSTCLKMCVDRIVTPFRAASEPVSMDSMEGSISERGEVILGHMAAGRLSPGDAASVMTALGTQLKILESSDLLERIERLERANETKAKS